MRNINRIYPIMNQVLQYWLKYPDQRFGQVISNLFGDLCTLDNNIQDIFYVEDDKWLELLKQLNENK